MYQPRLWASGWALIVMKVNPDASPGCQAVETWRHTERNVHQVEVSVDLSYEPAFKAKLFWVRVLSVFRHPRLLITYIHNIAFTLLGATCCAFYSIDANGPVLHWDAFWPELKRASWSTEDIIVSNNKTVSGFVLYSFTLKRTKTSDTRS